MLSNIFIDWYDEYDDYGYEYGYGYDDTSSYYDSGDGWSLTTCILAGIAAGIVISLVICLILKMKMNTARIAREANEYMAASDLNLSVRQDIFTHSTVTRVKIESNKPRGGGPPR